MVLCPGEIEGVEVQRLSLFTDKQGWLTDVFRSD